MKKKEWNNEIPKESFYSCPVEFNLFEKQTVYFEELRNRHGYSGGNKNKEMIDYCKSKNLKNIEEYLMSLPIHNNYKLIKTKKNDN
ncbi:hypothetical protein [Chryseobacterium sp. 18068]|uniref:hypothetical protein n=1 Tax=Chryseobacterium sp. 18068 TaxID=2681414 RepID=UPI00135BA9AD|nr:hypothetical protein [Chryseobacterium sp. 18068]